MSINSTIVHTWQGLVVKDGHGRQERVQAKTKKEARAKLKKQFNAQQVRNVQKVS